MKKLSFILKLEVQSVYFSIVRHIPGFVLANKIRVFLIKPFLRNCGKNFLLNKSFTFEVPEKISIGNNVGINTNCIISAGGGVSIGNNVLIGPNVNIFTANHNFKDKSLPFNLQGHFFKPVIIGNNVWIASNVIILPGVSICDNVVIAAGSVVTKNCESNYVYGGNPAKKIKSINE